MQLSFSIFNTIQFSILNNYDHQDNSTFSWIAKVDSTLLAFISSLRFDMHEFQFWCQFLVIFFFSFSLYFFFIFLVRGTFDRIQIDRLKFWKIIFWLKWEVKNVFRIFMYAEAPNQKLPPVLLFRIQNWWHIPVFLGGFRIKYYVIEYQEL